MKKALAKIGLPKKKSKAKGKKPSRKVTLPNSKMPIAPGSAYTFGNLKRDRTAAEQLEFAPKESELRSALTQSTQRQGTIGNWFDQYKNDIARAQAQSAAIHAQTVGDIGARAQQSQTQAAQDRAQVDSARSQDAALRGMSYTGAVSQDDAQAAASRRALQDALANTVAASGAANQSYYAGRGAVAGAARTNELLKETQYQQGITGKQAELAGLKGAWRTKYDQDAMKREQEYGLAAKGLNLKVETEKNNTRDKNIDNRRQSKKDKIDALDKRADNIRANKQLSLDERRYQLDLLKERRKALEGPKSKWTDVQRRDFNNTFKRGLTEARNIINLAGVSPKDPAFIPALQQRAKLPADIQSAIIDWSMNKGTISESTAKVLDDLGIPFKRERIRKSSKVPKKKK